MEPSGSCSPVSYSFKDLKLFTEGFSGLNFLGETQFGKLYRGKIPRGLNQTEDKLVTVKVWADLGGNKSGLKYQKQRLQDEIYFLQHPSVNNHPNLARLIGYCDEDQRLAVVYDLHPVDTLQSLIANETLGWIQRIKIAIGFARLLDFLHSYDPPYQVCNLAASHIMIDQDFNPKLCEFGMLTGGILGDRPNLPGLIIMGAKGYVDKQYLASGANWPGKRDVYAYGVLLLNLIAKKVVMEYPWDPPMEEWARYIFLFKRQRGSLVHESLQSEPAYVDSVGYAITVLAIRCFDSRQIRRPTMREIFHYLQDLLVIGSDGVAIGIQRMPGDDAQSVGSSQEAL